MFEHSGKIADNKIAYLGNGSKVCASLIHGASKLGAHVVVCSPEGYSPGAEVVSEPFEVTRDIKEAVSEADVVYSDIWFSPSDLKSLSPEQIASEENKFLKFQVTSELMSYAKPDAVFIHCLPAAREKEVSSEVLDGDQSIVFRQAQNRLWAHKAILEWSLQED